MVAAWLVLGCREKTQPSRDAALEPTSSGGQLKCGPSSRLVYTSPGCDDNVKASCEGAAGALGCTAPACGCDGRTDYLLCSGSSSVKFQYRYDSDNPDVLGCSRVPGFDAGVAPFE